MYEARQRKEKVSRRIDGGGGRMKKKEYKMEYGNKFSYAKGLILQKTHQEVTVLQRNPQQKQGNIFIDPNYLGMQWHQTLIP